MGLDTIHIDRRCLEENEDHELTPAIHKRTRRDRLIDNMPDWKRERNSKGRVFESKPKGFKHRK